MKVLTVVGARPQFVKAGPVSRALRVRHTELLVHTGQHYDERMSAAFFRDLEIPAPDVNLEVGSASHGAQTGEMMRRLEPVVLEHEPEWIVVYGDTNSTLAAAVVGSKVAFADGRRPRLAHVEAGLRSFNRAMPEERNRVVADHLADLLLAPTRAAMEHLASEGLAPRAELVGDVMVDAWQWAAERASGHMPAAAAKRAGYLLLTLHRAENVDDPERLTGLIGAIAAAAAEIGRPVIFPVHPRTRAMLDRHQISLPAGVQGIDPAGPLEMVALERAAGAVATDSGGVQKEAYLAGVPCITLRAETEWVETVDAGWNRITGTDPAAVHAALTDAAFLGRERPRPNLYGDGHTADRIVAALERHAAGDGDQRSRATERSASAADSHAAEAYTR